MDLNAIETSYARWARIYDSTFGAATNVGRQRAVDYINSRGGRVLEVGVGTGLSLEHYKDSVEVTGIDFSEEMLNKARKKVAERGLSPVKNLRRMDARALDFPDNHFDTVTAMHVLSVVPEPERVMSEIARVCKPGGKVVITNHFVREKGPLATVGRLLAPFADTLGWHSDFEIQTVLKERTLAVQDKKALPPLGMMTLLTMEKAEAA